MQQQKKWLNKDKVSLLIKNFVAGKKHTQKAVNNAIF